MLSLDLKSRYDLQYSRLQQLGYPCRQTVVSLAFGPVAVTELGDKSLPPLIALHGMHTPGPFMLELFVSLAREYCVICPDLPGHAGMTPGLAALSNTQGYAIWLEQFLNSQNIGSCPFVGLSFGGAVLLDMAAYQPERISAASLVVPAGFFRPLWRPLKRLLLPFVGFKLQSDREHFEQMMQPLMADHWSELGDYFYAVYQAGIPLALVPPGPFEQTQLSRFSAPVQLITAAEDLYFSSDKLLKKARAVLPNLVEDRLVDDLHIPQVENRLLIQKQVTAFMLNNTEM